MTVMVIIHYVQSSAWQNHQLQQGTTIPVMNVEHHLKQWKT